MSTNREKILDDLARFAGGAAGFLGDTGKQVQNAFRARFDDWAQSMNLVPREDFDRVELMLSEARIKQDDLEKRLTALEKQIQQKKIEE